MKQFIKWSVGIVAGVVGVMFALTQACNMITAASNVQVILGFLLIAITWGVVVYGGYWVFTKLEPIVKEYLN
jgi:hypothetical protein